MVLSPLQAWRICAFVSGAPPCEAGRVDVCLDARPDARGGRIQVYVSARIRQLDRIETEAHITILKER